MALNGCWPQSALTEVRQASVLYQTWASASHLATPTTVDTYFPFKSQPGVTSSRTFTLTTLSLGSNPNHCNEQFHHPLFMCLSPRLVWESSSKAGVYPYPSPLQCLA